MTIPPPPFHCNCGLDEPAAGAKRPDVAKGREGERSEIVVPEAGHYTYKMPTTRQTIKPRTRLTNIQPKIND